MAFAADKVIVGRDRQSGRKSRKGIFDQSPPRFIGHALAQDKPWRIPALITFLMGSGTSPNGSRKLTAGWSLGLGIAATAGGALYGPDRFGGRFQDPREGA